MLGSCSKYIQHLEARGPIARQLKPRASLQAAALACTMMAVSVIGKGSLSVACTTHATVLGHVEPNLLASSVTVRTGPHG